MHMYSVIASDVSFAYLQIEDMFLLNFYHELEDNVLAHS
jgi:hypothetical protein